MGEEIYGVMINSNKKDNRGNRPNGEHAGKNGIGVSDMLGGATSMTEVAVVVESSEVAVVSVGDVEFRCGGSCVC